MSKPPKIVIPGLNRGAGIRGGYIVGRHWREKTGPAKLLNLHDVVAQGIETIAGSSQKNITTASTAHSETVSVSTSNSTSLSQVSSSLSGAISTNTGQSTSLSQISSSLSGAISSTTSLSTAVSTVISGSISSVNSRIDSLSTAIGGGGGSDDDSALSTSLSNQSTSLSQISSSLSGAISSTSSLSTAVSTVDLNQSTSISANLSKINSLSTAIGGGASWTELGWYDGTTSIISQVFDVSAYNDVKVTFKDITMLSSGIPGVVVSVDGGGTYFTASGDYIEISTAGIKTNDAAFFSHGTAATAARSGTVEIHGLRSSRAQKMALTPAYITPHMMFVSSGTAITHIKVYGISAPSTAISITGGTFQVEAR